MSTDSRHPSRRRLGLVVLAILLSLAAMAATAAERAASFASFDARARAGERLSVVFFGASLTWGANATDQATTSYRARVASRLEQRYPAAHFGFHDAAIGGTGSQLGVFRVERDVLRWKPDLVFLDFTANDDVASADPETLASYEAIVRRLVVDEAVPVVQVAFPFRWNIARDQLPRMQRMVAHQRIAEAYGCGWGDAIGLILARVESGQATLDELWDTDPVHPGDAGYELFAAAAWDGFTAAVEHRLVGATCEPMLAADTYRTAHRVRFAQLDAMPAGWRAARPDLTGLFYDWTPTRWLDGEVVATNAPDTTAPSSAAGAPAPPPIAPFRLTVRAQSILLLGEATAKSGGLRVRVDGKPVPSPWDPGKGGERIDGNRWQGTGLLLVELARGLDPAVDHRVEIEPEIAPDRTQEIRLESLLLAGGAATAVVER